MRLVHFGTFLVHACTRLVHFGTRLAHFGRRSICVWYILVHFGVWLVHVVVLLKFARFAFFDFFHLLIRVFCIVVCCFVRSYFSFFLCVFVRKVQY